MEREPEAKFRFEDMVKEHGFVKARQLVQRSTIQQHQAAIEKKELEIHASLRPQRIKASIIQSSTSGNPAEHSLLEKLLQSNRGIKALEHAGLSGDLLSASKSMLQLVTAREQTLPRQQFLLDDDVRYALQSAHQQLLIPNKGYACLPEGVGETLLLQTAYVREMHCARNHLRSLLHTSMPQLSTYHLRYVRSADLSYNELVRLPDAIGQMQQLTRLDLTANRLSRLPASFLTLKQLHTLVLEGNSFDKLPEELGSLDALTYLDLSRNLFASFPYPLTRLRALKTLKLAQNLLTNLAILPPLLRAEDLWLPTIDPRSGQAVHMNVLTKERLTHIELYDGKGIKNAADLHVFQPMGSSKSYRRRRLWLSVCGIDEWAPVSDGITGGTYFLNNVSNDTSSTMPASLDTLGTMRSLAELVLSRNSIGSLPSSFLQLTNLKKLVFTQNRLRELPEQLGELTGLQHMELTSNELKLLPVSIVRCKALGTLLLTDNHLLRLPDDMGAMASLKLLDVTSNRLRQLPYSLGFSSSLGSLLASENPMEDPPVAEFAKGLDQLKWYLRNKHAIALRGMPPLMQYHTIGINNEILLLQPELMETVQQRIIGAKKDGILNLQLLGLKELPVSVLRMRNLKKLKLDFNADLQLQSIPRELQGIQALSLRGCQLTSLPEDVHVFTALTVLSLEENRLEVLPLGISEITTLTTLDLSKNRLYSLPAGIEALVSLKTLLLESNNIEELPGDAISRLTELKVLNLAKNRLIDLPAAMCKLLSLTVLNVEKNDLYFLPEALRGMHLLELRVGHNRIERLSADLFGDALGRTVQMFSCCENNLLELPASLARLSPKSMLEADYNPLISPPPALLSEGLVTVQHYLAIREKRREKLIELLEDEDFEVQPQAFTPTSSEVLEDGTGFLSPEDLAEFDVAVHEFLNSEYYRCPATAEELVASIAKLREDRETELYLTIIRTFLSVLAAIEDEPDHRYANDSTIRMTNKPWGRDGEACACYAVSLPALLRDTPPSSFYPEGRPSIFSLIAQRMPHISFPFTIDLLKDSIRLYVSPYGIIADTEQVIFSACDCMDTALNKPKRHDVCTKAAVLIAKSVYVEEEADRREKEEDEFMERFEEIDFNVRIWLLTEEGQKAMSQEVRARKNVLKEETSLREEMLFMQQMKQTKAKNVLDDLLNRKALLETGAAYEQHGFTDLTEALKKINKAEDDVNVLAERIEILTDMVTKLKASTNQDYQSFCFQAAADLVQKYCVLGYHSAVLAFRRYAAANGLQRHWDGEDGAAYLEWKSKHTILPVHLQQMGAQGDDSDAEHSNNNSRPSSAGGGGMERSASGVSVNSASSADTNTSHANSKVSVRNTAVETEFDWKDTSKMEKYQHKLYARYRNANPFTFMTA